MIAAGRLRDRVTVQRASQVEDGAGGRLPVWSDVATHAAEVAPISARERWTAQAASVRASHRVTMRAADVRVDDRLMFRGKALTVSTKMERGPRGEVIELLCEEVVRS